MREGKVVKVLDARQDGNAYSVVVNVGQKDGVKPGAEFVIYALGEELADPDTQESLGRLEIVRGRARVEHLQESMATLRTSLTRQTRYETNYLAASGVLSGDRPHVTERVEDSPIPLRGVVAGDSARLVSYV